jgi:RNA recognition motif-containing protein
MDPGSPPVDAGDLSFDLLFVDNSSSSSSSNNDSGTPRVERETHAGKQMVSPNHPNHDNDLGMKFGTSHPDDNDGSMGLLSMSAPQSGAGARRRTRSRKRTTTLCKNEKDAVVEKEKLSIFIYSCNAKKLRWNSIIQLIDDRIREPREFYYRENQCFGFIQFQQTDVASKAVELLNDIDVGGSILGVERCTRGCPGRDDTTPLVKNSILVIKNLPYNMKEEKLRHILHAFEEQRPEDVSFHHDSSGTFRGMAFVKYSSIQDAAFVFDHINSIDVGGRPIKVEYKRKPDPSDEDHQKIQQQLQHFKDNDDMSDLAFPFSLSNSQRKQIHSIAEKLGLRYQSYGENENRYIIVSKKKEDDGKVGGGGSHQIPKRKTSGASSASSVGGSWNDKNSFHSHPSSQKYGSSWSNDRTSTSYESSPKFRVRSYSKGSKSTNKSESVPASPSFPSYIPQREPKGPDGTMGFSEKYRQNRLREVSHVTVPATTAVTIES